MCNLFIHTFTLSQASSAASALAVDMGDDVVGIILRPNPPLPAAFER